jgi:hypothetical protein
MLKLPATQQAKPEKDWAAISKELDALTAQRKEPENSSLLRRVAADPLVSVAKGVTNVGQSVVGAADLVTGGHAGKALQDYAGYDPTRTNQFLDDLYTEDQQKANKEVQSAEGFAPTIGAAIANPSTIPHSVIESLPLMLGGQAIGSKLITSAPKLVGGIGAGLEKLAPNLSAVGSDGVTAGARLAGSALGEGALTAGSQAEQIRSQSEDGLLSAKQSALAAGSGLATGAISGLSGGLTNRLGLGDVDTAFMGGNAPLSNKSFVTRGLQGALTEGVLEELPQSAQEQIASNVALDKPWDEGVGNAAAMGALTGAAQGGFTSAIMGGNQSPDVDNTEQPTPLTDTSLEQEAVQPTQATEQPTQEAPPEPEGTLARAVKPLALPAPNEKLDFDRTNRPKQDTIVFADGSTISSHEYYDSLINGGASHEEAVNQTYQALNANGKKNEPLATALPSLPADEIITFNDGSQARQSEVFKQLSDAGYSTEQAHLIASNLASQSKAAKQSPETDKQSQLPDYRDILAATNRRNTEAQAPQPRQEQPATQNAESNTTADSAQPTPQGANPNPPPIIDTSAQEATQAEQPVSQISELLGADKAQIDGFRSKGFSDSEIAEIQGKQSDKSISDINGWARGRFGRERVAGTDFNRTAKQEQSTQTQNDQSTNQATQTAKEEVSNTSANKTEVAIGNAIEDAARFSDDYASRFEMAVPIGSNDNGTIQTKERIELARNYVYKSEADKNITRWIDDNKLQDEFLLFQAKKANDKLSEINDQLANTDKKNPHYSILQEKSKALAANKILSGDELINAKIDFYKAKQEVAKPEVSQEATLPLATNTAPVQSNGGKKVGAKTKFFESEDAAIEQAAKFSQETKKPHHAVQRGKRWLVQEKQEPEKGVVGGFTPSEGNTQLTTTGRETTPFPKINTKTKPHIWLLENAVLEAQARGDKFNERIFKSDLDAANKTKGKSVPPASVDSAEYYLFGDKQPTPVKPILKPLTGDANTQPTQTAPTPQPKESPVKPQPEKAAQQAEFKPTHTINDDGETVPVAKNDNGIYESKDGTEYDGYEAEPITAQSAQSGEKPLSEMEQVDADIDDVLGDIGRVLMGRMGKGVMPTDDSAELLPLMSKLMGLAVKKGYLTFKENARFVLDTIRAKLGDDVANTLDIDDLQAGYIAMKQGTTPKKEVVSYESIDELLAEEPQQAQAQDKAEAVTEAEPVESNSPENDGIKTEPSEPAASESASTKETIGNLIEDNQDLIKNLLTQHWLKEDLKLKLSPSERKAVNKELAKLQDHSGLLIAVRFGVGIGLGLPSEISDEVNRIINGESVLKKEAKPQTLQSVIESRDIPAILSHIEANGDSFNKKIAALLKSKLPNDLTLQLQDLLTAQKDSSREIPASYTGKTINVSRKALGKERLITQAILHELTHAATVHALKGNGKLRIELNRIISLVKKSNLVDSDGFMVINGTRAFNISVLSNNDGKPIPEELIAYGLTNPMFQIGLEAIEFDSELSLWDKFVNAIASALGITEKADRTALAGVLKASALLMDEQAKEVTEQSSTENQSSGNTNSVPDEFFKKDLPPIVKWALDKFSYSSEDVELDGEKYKKESWNFNGYFNRKQKDFYDSFSIDGIEYHARVANRDKKYTGDKPFVSIGLQRYAKEKTNVQETPEAQLSENLSAETPATEASQPDTKEPANAPSEGGAGGGNTSAMQKYTDDLIHNIQLNDDTVRDAHDSLRRHRFNTKELEQLKKDSQEKIQSLNEIHKKQTDEYDKQVGITQQSGQVNFAKNSAKADKLSKERKATEVQIKKNIGYLLLAESRLNNRKLSQKEAIERGGDDAYNKIMEKSLTKGIGQSKQSSPDQSEPTETQPTTEEISKAAHEAATSPLNDLPQPTQAQKEAGNYKKGHITLHGLNITIEIPKGAERSGVDKKGKKWSIKMAHHYGYIKGTVGNDNDHVDVFIGENPESEKVFVVNQIDQSTGKFDEHKVLLGFDSLPEAKAGYLANYSKGWKGGDDIAEISMDEFKEKLNAGKLSKPIKAANKQPTITLNGKETPLVDVFQQLKSSPKNAKAMRDALENHPDKERILAINNGVGTNAKGVHDPILQALLDLNKENPNTFIMKC